MALIQGVDYRIAGGQHRCSAAGCNGNGMVACYQGQEGQLVWPRRFCVTHFVVAEHLAENEWWFSWP